MDDLFELVEQLNDAVLDAMGITGFYIVSDGHTHHLYVDHPHTGDQLLLWDSEEDLPGSATMDLIRHRLAELANDLHQIEAAVAVGINEAPGGDLEGTVTASDLA